MKLLFVDRKFCSYFTLTFLLCFLSVLISFAQTKNQFTLLGKIDGINGEYIYFSYQGFGNGRIWDSTKIANNKFEFKGTLNGQAKCFIAGVKSTNTELTKVAEAFFIEPAIIHIKLDNKDFKKCIITGSKVQAELKRFMSSTQLVYAKLLPLEKLFDSIHAVTINQTDTIATTLKAGQLDELRAKMAPYYNKLSILTKRFIKTHPSSLAATDFLRDKKSGYTLSDLEKFFYKMPASNRNNPIASSIKEYIASKKIGLKGSDAAEFSAKELRGDSIRLSDYKGKYVLLDFWASWCVPCRADNPELIMLYKKYSKLGIEFIGISDNDYQVDKWQDAIEKDRTEIWKQVLRGYVRNYDRNPLDIHNKYGIHTLPTKILIGPDGKIVERFGEGGIPKENLAAILKSVFKNKHDPDKLKEVHH